MKIKKMYENLSLPLKASFWFAICSLLQKGILFFVTPIYTRLLSVEEYGFFSIYQSWLSVISVIATLSLSGGVLNNALNKCNNEGEKNKVLSNFQFLEILLVSFCSIVVYAISCTFPSVFSLPKNIMAIMCINILMNSSVALWTTKSKFDYNYKPVIINSFISSILTIVLSLIFIKFGDNKNYSLIYGSVMACLFSYISIMIGNLLKGKSINNIKLWKFALAFNLPLLPHYLSLTVLSSSDRIMIERLSNYSSAALYSIAYNISSILSIFATAINSSLIPLTYKKLKEKDYYSLKSKIDVILLFLTILCMFVMLLGPEIIYILGGDKYLQAKWVIPPVVAGVFFLFLYPIFANVEFFYEKRYLTTICSIVGALLNITLNYIFIPIFGYIAAAFTTLVCYVILSICHYFGYRKIIKKEKIPNLYSTSKIVLFSIINLVVIFLVYLLYINFVVRYIFLCILLILILIKRKKFKEIIKNYIIKMTSKIKVI